MLQTRNSAFMLEALDLREPLLINTLGHAAGVLLFGLFLWLFMQDQRGAQRRRNWLPVAIAVDALIWNLGSLAVLAASHYGLQSADLLVAISFSVLSLLPALLLHFSIEDRLPAVRVTGYVMSGLAVVLHFVELKAESVNWHQAAILLITVGFTILTAASVVLLRRVGTSERTRGSQVWGTMCLFLFATSFVHFGTGHARHAWSAEIAVHHAGIPLALLVLLQDFRFLLLDAFLRFLVNAFAAAAFIALLVTVNVRLALLERASGDPFLQGMLAVSLCLVFLAFAFFRSRLQRWLTLRVFRRPAPETAIQPLRALGAASRDEGAYLESAAQRIGDFISAQRVELARGIADPSERAETAAPYPVTDRSSWRLWRDRPWIEAVLPLRLPGGETLHILLGRRSGGRRYLSEDLASLSQLAAVVIEQVERFREAEMQRLVSRAELRALQAQINPHFLFNSLNTLYGTIPRDNPDARRIVLNLADVFRYFLQSEKTFISLSEELRIVEAYLEIEALRLGGRLKTQIEVDDSARSLLIPVLSIQPLIENAVKHGIAMQTGVGVVRLRVEANERGTSIRVEDSGNGFRPSNGTSTVGAGVGLENVRRRLQLCYGPAANLLITSSESGSSVEFLVPQSAV